jgi:hypothetical protein
MGRHDHDGREVATEAEPRMGPNRGVRKEALHDKRVTLANHSVYEIVGPARGRQGPCIVSLWYIDSP